MKKFNFNLKLTAFLVSLFIGLTLVILGSYNKYCLAFGFFVLGMSLELFVWYNNEKIQKELIQLNEDIDEVDVSEELTEEDQTYILQQLYSRQHKLEKKKKSTLILFSICGASIALLGIVGLF